MSKKRVGIEDMVVGIWGWVYGMDGNEGGDEMREERRSTRDEREEKGRGG